MTPAGSSKPTAIAPGRAGQRSAEAGASLVGLLVSRVTGDEASGLLTSLLFHAALLLALATTVVRQVRPGVPIATVLFSRDRSPGPVEFALIDTTIQRPPGESDPPPGPPRIPLPAINAAESLKELFPEPAEGGAAGSGASIGSAPPAGALPEIPDNAVQAGSFTAWWIPKVERYGEKVVPGQLPRVGQEYQIVVQIRVPEGRRSFRVEDLSGEIVGTDGYRQNIPDRAWSLDEKGELTRVAGRPLLRVIDGYAQIVFKVQGAGKAGVRDTIRIRSRMLSEEQTLVLVFQPREP
jgi:hypothetical protein